MNPRAAIRKSNKFKKPGEVRLTHLFKGQITKTNMKIGNWIPQENIYIRVNQTPNLISKSAIQALQLLKLTKVYNVDKLQFRTPTLFKGLGLDKERYKIELKEDDIPSCRYTQYLLYYCLPLSSCPLFLFSHMHSLRKWYLKDYL